MIQSLKSLRDLIDFIEDLRLDPIKNKAMLIKEMQIFLQLAFEHEEQYLRLETLVVDLVEFFKPITDNNGFSYNNDVTLYIAESMKHYSLDYAKMFRKIKIYTLLLKDMEKE